MKGKFITFEGAEGSGKTTQADMLAQRLQKEGRDVVIARDPGSTYTAERIREILLDPRAKMDGICDLFLYSASRRVYVCEIVKPNLEAGRIVISDRFYDSTTAYQGYGSGVDLEIIDYLNHIASMGIVPDLTFLLDIDAEQGLIKAGKRGRADRIEARDMAFHRRVAEGYRDIARKNPERFRVIPWQEGKQDKMHEKIYQETRKLLSPGK